MQSNNKLSKTMYISGTLLTITGMFGLIVVFIVMAKNGQVPDFIIGLTSAMMFYFGITMLKENY